MDKPELLIKGLRAVKTQTPRSCGALCATVSARGEVGLSLTSYAPLSGRAHILPPPQQALPSFLDVIVHLPSAQHAILLAESLDIMEQVLPSLPWQQLPPLQHAPSFALLFESFPPQVILLSAWPWLQQAQDLAEWSSVEGVL